MAAVFRSAVAGVLGRTETLAHTPMHQHAVAPQLPLLPSSRPLSRQSSARPGTMETSCAPHMLAAERQESVRSQRDEAGPYDEAEFQQARIIY